MTTKFRFDPTVCVAAMACVFSAVAADIPKEGRYDFTNCGSGVSNPIQFSKTHSASTNEQTGTIRSNTPGGLFDKVAYRCIGMNRSFDGKSAGVTVCEGADPDGDRYLNHIVSEGPNTTRTVVVGTGKYEGIVASGTVEALGPFPAIKPGTFQNCSRQTGTYKLK